MFFLLLVWRLIYFGFTSFQIGRTIIRWRCYRICTNSAWFEYVYVPSNSRCLQNIKFVENHIMRLLDDHEVKIVRVQCHNCAASTEGCKHCIAFLMWVHKRSVSGKKSKLAQLGTNVTYITVIELSSSKRPIICWHNFSKQREAKM